VQHTKGENMTKLEELLQEQETLYTQFKNSASTEEANLLEIKLRALSYAIQTERDNQREQSIIDKQYSNSAQDIELIDTQLKTQKAILSSQELNIRINQITNLLNFYKSMSPLEIKNRPDYQENITRLENALSEITISLTIS